MLKCVTLHHMASTFSLSPFVFFSPVCRLPQNPVAQALTAEREAAIRAVESVSDCAQHMLQQEKRHSVGGRCVKCDLASRGDGCVRAVCARVDTAWDTACVTV